ncbi:hypothetical protein TorRG33x02_250450 [Trema orientale]|uniref:Uncharacterized protein n=1 Tax=Trema orientale TaxID=63057 RepID=A0A2P5DIE1_TREOI|nr:hypothetical protein TorRG33x02_250450 [Trema orientale]
MVGLKVCLVWFGLGWVQLGLGLWLNRNLENVSFESNPLSSSSSSLSEFSIIHGGGLALVSGKQFKVQAF